MAIRYDPLLIAGLAEQARGRWTGRQVEGLWLDRDRREAWLVFADGAHEDRAVGFLLHPTSGFIIVATTVPPEDPRAGRRISFRKLFVTAVESPVDERLIVDAEALDAIGRMGGFGYCTTRDRFEMPAGRSALELDS